MGHFKASKTAAPNATTIREATADGTFPGPDKVKVCSTAIIGRLRGEG